MPDISLEASRAKVAPLILKAAAVAVVPNTLAAAISGASPVLIAVLSVCLPALAAFVLHLDRVAGRTAIALACIGQVMLLTAALQGHPWQVDVHLFVFVALGAIAAMIDLRALFCAAGAIILHHGLLTIFAPHLIHLHPDPVAPDVLMSAAMHLMAVAAMALILGLTICLRIRLVAAAENDQQEGRAARIAAEAAERRATEALEVADIARAAADIARTEAERALAHGMEESRRADDLDAVVKEERARLERSWGIERERQEAAVDVLRIALDQLARGDLTIRIAGTLPDNYADISTCFDSTLDTLEQALRGIRQVSATITWETDEIASGALELSHRTDIQATSLEEITASTDQLTQSIRKTAEDAGQAVAVMETTGADAQSGAEIMKQAILAMTEIEASASEIRKITSTIEDIAFQTNLLALNAGVEAARAGDAGRGFAVVASEVRTLARRSSEAANGIDALIARSGEQIKRGGALVHETGSALEAIIAAVETATTHVSRIASTSDEQATGVNGINAALRNLDEVSQQNASMFEDTNAACQTLRTSASALSTAIQEFGGAEQGYAGKGPAARGVR